MFHLMQFTDTGLLLLRLMVGVGEALGALGLIVGILTQLVGIGLMLISLGAIWKKIAAWHTGFWGENAAGWHYDLMLMVMNVVIVAADGGRYVLMA
ncbi:MAG: DoxX family protein [Bacillati bacterium ANGP1]|uniref:DoxX family protein n=1 Tax=Candidatus Segetimicrobium genomatis TaxID=2569760 RepID=A0A537J6M1_9BACT|nr:MAG: DoxX family protein [Terrabacteria group bacterium ANGP1]